MTVARLVILGAPRTKKTSAVIATNRKTGKPFILPHKRTTGWTHDAQIQMRHQWRGPLLDGAVIVNYQIYRAADRGDLGGFEAAIDDALQGCVITDDKQIIGRATAKHIDRANPRVEILVTAA